MKAKLGQYSEITTAKMIADLAKKHKLSVTHNKLSKLQITKFSEICIPVIEQSDRIRIKSACKLLAETMFSDITKGWNLSGCVLDIYLSGYSHKGVSKADIILTLYKKYRPIPALKTISASIKIYKDTTINLANTTYTSFFNTLFPEEDFSKCKKMRKLIKYQNIIGEHIMSGHTKQAARIMSKTTHKHVTKILSDLFNEHYVKRKSKINERILKLIGLDGSDDVYIVTGNKELKVHSTESNPELNTLVQMLKSDFHLTMKHRKNTNTGDLIFTLKGKEILRANISLTDTGGNSAQGKTNIWVKLPKCHSLQQH